MKVPTFILPSIKESLEAGRSYPLLSLAVAVWIRYLRGVDYAGKEIEYQDPIKERVQGLALTGGPAPRPLLADHNIFDDLGKNPASTETVEQVLLTLDRNGPVTAIKKCFSSAGTHL